MAPPRLSRLLTVGAAQYAALAVLAVATVLLCFLALTRNMDADSAGGPTTGLTGTDGSAGASAGASDGGSAAPSPTASSNVVLPNVIDQVDADFATGAALPAAGRIYDNQDVSSGMVLQGGALVHGAPTGPMAMSSLEVRLTSDVQKVAATVSFPGTDPGTVVLLAWQDSLVDARRAGNPPPPSGLRLEVTQTGWQLTTDSNGITTLQSGTYPAITGTAQVAVYRVGSRAYVVDPTGKVTRVRASQIAKFAGPWAGWQLAETGARQTPAQIEAVEAG